MMVDEWSSFFKEKKKKRKEDSYFEMEKEHVFFSLSLVFFPVICVHFFPFPRPVSCRFRGFLSLINHFVVLCVCVLIFSLSSCCL